MSRLTRFEEIQGNWEYERAIKPEDVDYLLERVEEYRKESHELQDINKKNFEDIERYKQALEEVLTEDDFEDTENQLERIITIVTQALAGDTNDNKNKTQTLE